jgi:transposase InsO family protein
MFFHGRDARATIQPAEFYEITPFSLPLAELNRELQHWEGTYNTVRPHQALGYLTPLEFLAQSSPQRKETKCH